jgi:hypothetical protein
MGMFGQTYEGAAATGDYATSKAWQLLTMY